jgi:outer membrane protein TolC
LKVHTRLSRVAVAIALPVIFTTAVSPAVFAQTPAGQSSGRQAPLTLQAAIAMAQNRGPAAQVARSTRNSARYRNDAFNSRLFPQLLLTGNAANLNHGINAITLPDGTTQFIGQAQNQSNFQIGFSQQIPLTDATITVSSALSRIDLFGNTKARYYQTSPFILSIQQNLFKPRKMIWDKRTQSLNASVAERSYLEAREDVAGATADAFFNLYAQQMALANAEGNMAVNDTLYTLNKGRYEVGKIGENDLLKSELALLRARAAVDDARLARDRAEAALRRIIEYPDGEPLAVVTPDSIPVVAADPDVAVAEALKNSSTTQQNALSNISARRAIAEARANNRFNATISASAGFNQTSSGFGKSYQNPLGQQSLTVGVTLPMLQWGAGRADVEAALSDAEAAKVNNKTRRDALVENARYTALQLQQALRNVAIAAKTDTVADKQFEVARNRYIVSKISNTDLYGAQVEKDQAVMGYVQALRTYWTVYYQLRRITLYDFVRQRPLVDGL